VSQQKTPRKWQIAGESQLHPLHRGFPCRGYVAVSSEPLQQSGPRSLRIKNVNPPKRHERLGEEIHAGTNLCPDWFTVLPGLLRLKINPNASVDLVVRVDLRQKLKSLCTQTDGRPKDCTEQREKPHNANTAEVSF